MRRARWHWSPGCSRAPPPRAERLPGPPAAGPLPSVRRATLAYHRPCPASAHHPAPAFISATRDTDDPTTHPSALACTLLLATTPYSMAQSAPPAPAASGPADPYLWLEDVLGERALAWVRERNAATRPTLEAHPDFEANRARFKQIMDSRERIPYATRQGDWFYNFWRDETHPRGLWRRTSLAEYRKAEPAWELLLDLDALARDEKENWVWAGAECLGGASSRCLLQMSRGGADARVVREFDLASRSFVAGGFSLPEAKSRVHWLDENRLIVGTDFGPGSMTDSGYPRVLKLWTRGQPLSSATTIFEAQPADVSADATVDHTPGFKRVVVSRAPDFYTTEESLWQDGRLQRIDKPADAQLSFWRDLVLIELRSDWNAGGRTWSRGSLLVTDAAAYLRGERRFEALFTPTATRSLASFTVTRSQVLLNLLDNVAGRAEAWSRRADGTWQGRAIDAPYPGTLSVQALHDPMVAADPLAEAFFANYTDFLTPDSLYLANSTDAPLQKLKSRPAFFDATGMKVEQRFATSKDGTRVPYFVVWPRGVVADGRNPTVLYGYGGYQVSMNPGIRVPTAMAGSARAACWWWPTSVAAASSARPGTRPRSRPTSRRATTTSSPWPRT